MTALKIQGTSTLIHPDENEFELDSPHAPWMVSWSPEYLREQIRCGLTLEVVG